MVIGLAQARVDVCGGRAVDEDVVGGLDGEGFFDFGGGGEEEVDEDGEWDEVFCGFGLAFGEGSGGKGIWERQCWVSDLSASF